MSLNALRQGSHIKIGPARFLILQKLSDNNWQLQNTATGEWCKLSEDELLDRFTRNELVFDRSAEDQHSGNHHSSAQLDHALSTYPLELVAIAQNRAQYLKEIDQLQPIAITSKTMEPLIQSVSERIHDAKPPGWRTLARDYGKWLRAGRDIRAVISRHSDKGSRGPRMIPEVKAAADEVIDELYMTEERKRVPEVHLEIVRRLADANRFRSGNAPLPIPSRRTIYREIERRSPYELMVARYGKRRAEMEFRVSGSGPETSRGLQRVSMDHTPSDMIVVDDATMLPLGRPTITSALDEHTRCPMGFYTGFEPPSCLSVMRCLKHAILPKTYVPREFPSIKNSWECYGVPELVVVDNPPEFHSGHFERACLQIGTDIQYAKVLVPWYKGKLERFQGTMNHDLMHGNPGTTFSNILERDDYDPTRHAVVLLSTHREMLHKWIIDVYLQTPHRGIKDTPAHRWHSDLSALPPPLPPSASELEVALGMTAQRVVFHYGIELEGLKYNGPELGELRRRMGVGAKIELTFDPGDLGHVNVLDPENGVYIIVPAVNQAYARGLSFWQNKVIRRYAQRQLNARTDIVALAQAKAEIRALVERDFNRKSTRGRKRHARFMEDHTTVTNKGRTLRGDNANYRITKALKPGAFGQTYFAQVISVEAKHATLRKGQEVVLKIPRVPKGLAFEAAERAIKDLLGAFAIDYLCLQHLRGVSHVAHVLDSGHCMLPFGGSHLQSVFLVEQKAPGNTFDVYLETLHRKRAVNSKRFLGIATKLTKTLRDIHRAQVIHGDIWYPNLMCDSSENIYYIDFGQGLLRDMVLGAAPTVGGHPFLPPERGKSVSGDLYCLGLVLYYVATGKRLPSNLEAKPPRYLLDDDELKAVVVAGIKDNNQSLYSENPGVADIISRCLRYDVHHRVLSADRLLEEIEASSPAAPRPFDLYRLQQHFNRLLKSGIPLYTRMAQQQARRLDTVVADMCRGMFDLTGSHEDIVSGLSEYLSFLDRNDQYLTASQPSFWATRNLGIMGRFLSQNILAALRGATIRRVFLITADDEADPEFWRIIQAQLDAIEQVSLSGINTTDRDLKQRGYWIGYHSVTKEQRDSLVAMGRHFGILSKNRSDTVAIVTYNPDGQVVAVRFRAAPAISTDQRQYFSALLKEAIPLGDYKGTAVRTPSQKLP